MTELVEYGMLTGSTLDGSVCSDANNLQVQAVFAQAKQA
jgi:hypothetical protein